MCRSICRGVDELTGERMDDKCAGGNDGYDPPDHTPRHLPATNYRQPCRPVPPVIAILGNPCRAVEMGRAAARVDQLVGQSDSSWSNRLPTTPRYRWATKSGTRGLGETSRRPCPRRNDEGRSRHPLPAVVPQQSLPPGVEPLHVPTRRANAEHERLPPLLEARMLHLNREDTLLDLIHACQPEELRKVAATGARKARLVLHLRVERARRIPEHTQRPAPAGVIPDAGGHDSAPPGHPRHLAKPRDGVGHEVDDELRQNRVEPLILERQVLRRGTLHLHPNMAMANCFNKLFRGIDRPDRVSPQPPDQLSRQRPGTAADVQASLTTRDSGEFGKPRGQRHRITAHEPVVLVRTDVEALVPLPFPHGRKQLHNDRARRSSTERARVRVAIKAVNSRTPTSRSRCAAADRPG